MASRTGPAIAAAISLVAIGGAAYAQADAKPPAKKVVAVQPPLSCATTLTPSAPAETAGLVPALASTAIVCVMDSGTPSSVLTLDGAATARLISELNAPDFDPAGASAPPASCGATLGAPSYIELGYGIGPNVVVELNNTVDCGLYASNGQTGAAVTLPDLPQVHVAVISGTANSAAG